MSAPAAPYHGVDIVNLNALVIDIRERLSGGLSGDFYEKGGTIKEGARHAQLPLLFNAMAKIESLGSALEKQAAAAAEAEETKEAQKSGGKPNKNMMATIKEMVYTEVEAKTRSVTIESERMKTAMQKLEAQNAHLAHEVASLKSLKSKLKKGGDQPATGSDEKYHSLSKKVDTMQKTQKHHDTIYPGLTRDLEALRGPTMRSSKFFTPGPGQTHPTMTGLSEQLDDLKTDLQTRDSSLRTICDATKADLTEHKRQTAWVARYGRSFLGNRDEDDEDEDDSEDDGEESD